MSWLVALNPRAGREAKRETRDRRLAHLCRKCDGPKTGKVTPFCAPCMKEYKRARRALRKQLG